MIENKLFVVIAVMALIFTGVFFYLFTLDRKMSRLEKWLHEIKDEKK
jgi:CcmD family protein